MLDLPKVGEFVSHLDSTEHTEGSQSSIYELNFEDDYQIILKAFLHLHAFWKVAIRVDGFSDTDALLQHYENIIMRADYGGEREKGDHFELLRHVDNTYLSLVGLLDGLGGHTSSMLRLERFRAWYEDGWKSKSLYMNRLQSLLPSYKGYLNSGSWILRRFQFRNAFNPLSTNMQVMRFHQDCNKSPQQYPLSNKWCMSMWIDYYNNKLRGNSSGWIHEAEIIENCQLQTGWDRAEWHRYYPAGIPPLTDSSLTQFRVFMGTPIIFGNRTRWLKKYERDYLLGR